MTRAAERAAMSLADGVEIATSVGYGDERADVLARVAELLHERACALRKVQS